MRHVTGALRHTSLPLTLALLAILLLGVGSIWPRPAAAHEAGVHVDIRYLPSPLVAGSPAQFDLHATLGGSTAPVPSGNFFLSAQGPDGATVAEQALTAVGEGRWSGSLNVPREGIWSVMVRVDLLAGAASERFNVRVEPAGTRETGESANVVVELDPKPAPAASLRSYLPFVGGLALVGVLVALFLFMPSAQPEEQETA